MGIGSQVIATTPRPTLRRHPRSMLAGHGYVHHLQQDGALAAHARAASRLACAPAHHVHVFRALDVPASPAADFFAVVNEVSGRDCSFDHIAARTCSITACKRLQHEVRLPAAEVGVRSGAGEGEPNDTTVRLKPDTTCDRYHATVVVRRFGEAIFPVDVVTTFRDGQRVTERWDGRDRRAIYTTGLQRG